MGLDPDLIIPIVILDQGFDTGIGWDGGLPFFIAGGKLNYNKNVGVENDMSQFNRGFVYGCIYTINFTISNVNWASPTSGFIIKISGGKWTDPFRINGTFSVDIFAGNGPDALTFMNNTPTMGDFFQIDNVSVGDLFLDFLDRTEIELSSPPRYHNITAVNSDFCTTAASYNGRTNCLIGWNKV